MLVLLFPRKHWIPCFLVYLVLLYTVRYCERGTKRQKFKVREEA